MKNKLFMLTGTAGAGKDTIADFLVQHHHFVKFNFATVMKQYASKIYHVDLEYFYDRDKKDSVLPPSQGLGKLEGKTPRDLLVEYAARTRGEDRDYWSKVLLKEIEKEHNADRFVIADCRLRSEIEFIKSQKQLFSQVVVAWVSRSTASVVDNLELSQSDADLVIHNEQTPFHPEQINQCLHNYLL